MVDLHRLEPPTLPALQQQLRREQYHILHFIGHGIFSRTQQDGFLLVRERQHGGQRISGRDLGTILHDHRPLRLVMLNACGRSARLLEDQFAGAAQSLIQQGIPAVIAMQFRSPTRPRSRLAHEFYGALADGYPVDAALTEARKAIKTEGNDLEWGTPVLYMRSPDGRIFDIALSPCQEAYRAPTRAAEAERPARSTRFIRRRWNRSTWGSGRLPAWKLQQVLDADPGHKEAAAKLEIARQKLQAEELEMEVANAEKAGEWESACVALEKLGKLEPAFPNYLQG